MPACCSLARRVRLTGRRLGVTSDFTIGADDSGGYMMERHDCRRPGTDVVPRCVESAGGAATRDVVAGSEERLLLVEHPPVVTLGRQAGRNETRPDTGRRASSTPEIVELVESDRGGDVTFHGPGQLVAYPIVRLNDHRLSVGGYVHRLEEIVIATLADLGVAAGKDHCAVGVWTDDHGKSAKICAIGVRIRKGTTMHGLALNVSTDLRFFDLIVPCGLSGRAVTSLAKLLGNAAPSMADVKKTLVRQFDRRRLLATSHFVGREACPALFREIDAVRRGRDKSRPYKESSDVLTSVVLLVPSEAARR